MREAALTSWTAPTVIGATGGSGTRVVARIVRRAGYFIGTNLNGSEDSMEFPELYDRWINRYALRAIAPLCLEEEALLLRDVTTCVERHRSAMPAASGRWGWKEPRSIYLLPFLDQHWPGMKFIHVIRDGRDMAFSTNQNQTRKHGPAVLQPELQDAPQPLRSALLWARINCEAASYGDTRMADRYLRVKYENLCSDPRSTITEVLRFLGSEDTGPDDHMLREVAPPDSIGRWRNKGDPSTMDSIYSVAGAALQRFGYL
jgi:Sulfotransferase family